MSLERVGKVTCPECNHENEAVFWDSLNGDLDPEAKAQLLNGTLFQFRCAKCGYESFLNYPMLYHDMKNCAMVYYVRPDDIEKTIQEALEAEKKLPIKMDGYRKRVVCNQNSLREKAIIFDSGLDDRVIEVIKLLYYTNAKRQFPDNNIEAVYIMIKDGNMSVQILADTPLYADIPAEVYDDMCKQVAANLKVVGDDAFIVDMEWAKRVLHVGQDNEDEQDSPQLPTEEEFAKLSEEEQQKALEEWFASLTPEEQQAYLDLFSDLPKDKKD